jgi:hypothetical protein
VAGCFCWGTVILPWICCFCPNDEVDCEVPLGKDYEVAVDACKISLSLSRSAIIDVILLW